MEAYRKLLMGSNYSLDWQLDSCQKLQLFTMIQYLNAQQVKKFLMSINRWLIMSLALLLVITTLVITTLITGVNALNNPNLSYLEGFPLPGALIALVVVAPILETLVFQVFIYWSISKLIANKKYFCTTYLIASSLLFAASHYYSIAYVFYAICCGLVLSGNYFIFKERKENAFVFTVLIHGVFNFILLGIGHLIA